MSVQHEIYYPGASDAPPNLLCQHPHSGCADLAAYRGAHCGGLSQMTELSANPYCAALDALRAQPTHKLKEVGDQWRSPDALWWGINSLYGPFVLDLFADRDNAKCEAFYTAEDNALTQNWSARLAELNGAAYANPPYSRASKHEEQYINRHAPYHRPHDGNA